MRTRGKQYWLRTSNFSIAGQLPNSIAIARGLPPTWGSKPVDQSLAPFWPMLKMRQEDYIPRFIAILSKLNPREVLEKMDGKIMLCWCKPGHFCHRRMVAEWITTHTGIVVPEYQVGELLPMVEGQHWQTEFPAMPPQADSPQQHQQTQTGRRRLLPLGMTTPSDGSSAQPRRMMTGGTHPWQADAEPRV